MTDTAPIAEPVAPPAPVPANDDSAKLKAELSSLAEQVAHMADTVLATIPDALKALIPDGLSPSQKVAWYFKAKDTGVFAGKPEVPVTDTGKPTVTPKVPDVSSLPPIARMAAGYQR